jgi:hypothetical protein
VDYGELRNDREYLKNESRCISEETETVTRDSDVLNLEVGNLRFPCEDAATLEGHFRQTTMEPGELRDDTDSLTSEAKCISEETQTITRDSDVLNLEVGNLRVQCDDATALEGQLSQVTVILDKLRSYIEVIIDEAICISEKNKRPYTKKRRTLNLKSSTFEQILYKKFRNVDEKIGIDIVRCKN